MQPDEFLRCLHFDIDQVRPADVPVDWDGAPLPFKLYEDLPAIPLTSEMSLSLPAIPTHTQPSVGLPELANLCWYSYGLTQLCHVVFPPQEGEAGRVMQMLRRFVPSGGGLYPSELYVYVSIEGVSPGIYHYDTAHHRLVRLREGKFDVYLERALGHRFDVSACFATFFVSTMFWKNFFKYNDFSYRLQGLDAGVLVGQLLEVARRSGYAARGYFQFLDRSINHLLGLRSQEETVYAVIPVSLSEIPADSSGSGETSGRVEVAQVLCQEWKALTHAHSMKSKTISESPTITAMTELAMLDSSRLFTCIPPADTETTPTTDKADVRLPQVESLQVADFAAACRHRYSPGLDFVPDPIPLHAISTLFRQAAESLADASDLDAANTPIESRITLAGCIHGVEGLEDGAYLYDAKTHGLRLVRRGDQRMLLQKGMSMPSVNLFQVPLCVHLIGSRDFYQSALGVRGYRIQQMEVGIMLQRLLLSAAAMGMGGHPLLGYDEALCDDIYHLGPLGKTCLVQVPVGFYRKTSRFEGPLHG